MDELVRTVYGMVAEQVSVDVSVIRPESRLMEDLNADSLDIAELVMKMEERFGISIADEEATGLHTVGDAIGFLKSRLKDGAAAARGQSGSAAAAREKRDQAEAEDADGGGLGSGRSAKC